MKNNLEHFSQRSSLHRIHFSEEQRHQVIQHIRKTEEKPSQRRLKQMVGLVTVAVMFFVGLQFVFDDARQKLMDMNVDQPPTGEEKPPVIEDHPENKGEDDETQMKDQKIRKTFELIHNKYFRSLLQPKLNGRKVVNYDSKEALIQDLTQLVSHDIAKKQVDIYYEERETGLYLFSQGGLNQINFKKEIDLDRISEKKYRVSQEKQGAFFTGRVILIYEYRNGKWMIIEYDAKAKNR